MNDSAVSTGNLGEKIFEGAKTNLAGHFSAIKKYLKGESEKLAITLRMILEGAASGEISEDEARILINGQKVASSAVITAAQGMSAVAAQAALNAGLAVVKEFVNGKIGFALL
ncbi:hypothetical protein D3C87_1489660 [compost metagenome]